MTYSNTLLKLISYIPVDTNRTGISTAVRSENFSASKMVSNSSLLFTKELYGILKAIKYSANVVEENILIATDSKS